ncbi:cytochrome P450 [Xylariaceae sp. FL0255]|nr:cytochrome P450 [Xylariaceae sp. FL0255]
MDHFTTLFKAALGFVLAILAVKVIAFFSEFWRIRSRMQYLQRAGMPMPKHNWLTGSLLPAKTASDELPSDAHSSYVLNSIAEKVDSEAFYFDPFPINQSFLCLTDHYMAEQATSHQWTGQVKPANLKDWFNPISGRDGMNLFTQNGKEWKTDHETFLPFFNNGNLDATMPAIIDEMLIFRDILRKKSANPKDITRLEPLTLNLMNDVIGRVIFNLGLRNQTSEIRHPLSRYMLRQLELKFTTNDIKDNLGRLNPLRYLEVWLNGRSLDQQIRIHVKERSAAFHATKGHDNPEFSSMLDRMLASYFAQPGNRESTTVDSNTMTMLCAQLRMFYFAGYDSTSSTMMSLCYLVWKHPDVLAKLRAEHDSVFGRNIEACAGKILENPAILNSLPYTHAVIKEAMRLYPAAGGIREGCKDLVLRGRDGTEYPTEGVLIMMNHISIMRNPKTWPRPNEFLPERFLVAPGHELYPPKGAWRPFEIGVRNCTGQAFVLKELRAFLALIVREFDLSEAYAEVFPDEGVDLSKLHNEKAYLIESGSAHLRGKFPCRISLSGYGTAQ